MRSVAMALGLMLVWCALLAMPAPAHAADPCPLLRSQTTSAETGVRIAAIACEEHLHWHRPFIDERGRVAGSVVREAETGLLTNGEQAWRRVATYWRDSGLLPAAAGRPGAMDCAYAPYATTPSPACRAFVVDTPWSAAFVSWVMRRAALPGFNAAASHVAYVRDAYRSPETSAYRVAAPESAPVRPGDLLCYVRAANRVFGFQGLAQLLAGGEEGLGMHCDVIVGTDPGQGLAWLVGGNVFDAVTSRTLPLSAGGHLQGLSMRQSDDPACSPEWPSACDANRQDWTVLLQLQPEQTLAGLTPAPAWPPLQETAPTGAPMSAPGPGAVPTAPRPTQMCCIECVAGDGLPRCPVR
ncbi:DUF2272 domain-containing protein [Luteimonas abyssi]|uniref:DUF2272 domain-containing protein n=1 Tax=Luteimonas abyssi TaxID=1247514 RepID=UPI0009EC7B08|nr:DUF2272 domain-containing protein [Luteimonas abyssi]